MKLQGSVLTNPFRSRSDGLESVIVTMTIINAKGSDPRSKLYFMTALRLAALVLSEMASRSSEVSF